MKQNSGRSLLRLSGIRTGIVTRCRSPILEGKLKKFVEQGILFVLIIAVIVAIFAPVGVLIEEFLNIESGGSGSFNYKESCSNKNSTEQMVSIIIIVNYICCNYSYI